MGSDVAYEGSKPVLVLVHRMGPPCMASRSGPILRVISVTEWRHDGWKAPSTGYGDRLDATTCLVREGLGGLRTAEEPPC